MLEAIKATRWAEFYSLEYGDLLVVYFERRFSTLSSFVLRTQLCKEEKSWIFKERLSPRYRDLVSIQIRHIFKEVVDAAIIVERNFLTAQRGTQT